MIAVLLSAVARAACLVVANSTVHTPAGPVEGSLVVVDGTIMGVGESIAGLVRKDETSTFRGEPCTTVDGEGKQLTAGLFAAPTAIGLVEIGLEPASRDNNPETDDAVRASLVVADAIDPRSTLIAVQRIEGITHAISVPDGGFVSGQGAVIALRGESQSETVLVRSAVMAASVPTGSFADGLRQIRELLSDVRTHARSPTAYDNGRPYFPGASRLDLEALRPVADGKLPILVSANRASDLEALARLSTELGIRFIVEGAAEGWLVADTLAKAKMAVLVDPLQYGPSSFDSVHARPDNAAILAKAGVPLVLTTGSSHNARVLRQVAGNAVREGLSHADALRAITETPASVFGLPNRGKLVVGAVFDAVLWSGDPLELSSAAELVWIDGVAVTLKSRQSALRDRYRTLPGTPLPVLPVE